MPSLRGIRKIIAVAATACAGIALVGLPAGAAPADGPDGPALARQLVRKVTPDSMNRHLIAFQRIADRNGGIRAPGTPGYQASADYVTGKLTAAGFDVTVQPFPVRYSQPLAERLVVGGANVTMHMALYTKNTPVGGITAPLAVVPNDGSPGCQATDFAPGAFTGKIALILRGGCTFTVKQQLAADAGAVAVVLYNNADTWLRAGLASEADARIPTGGVSRSIGDAMVAHAGEPVTMELRTLDQMRTGNTIIAQTRTGRQDNVVVAGAHLDSVVEGPGVGTNGTGVAALLETAVQLGGSPRVNNAVRFVFWGSWEFGIVASPFYIQNLTFEQQLDIAMYLNFDGIGAPNAGYFVYGGAAGPFGSAQIEKAFTDYLTARGVQPETMPSAAVRSDQLSFTPVGIPSGGLFTGNQDVKTAAQAAKWGGTAGIPFDACYHEACDNLGNMDRAVLDVNADAMAWVTASYAISTEDVNGVPPRPQRAAARMAAAKTAKAAKELVTS
jgi:Zn-dependent M28 family amino/carboxypeptidase